MDEGFMLFNEVLNSKVHHRFAIILSSYCCCKNRLFANNILIIRLYIILDIFIMIPIRLTFGQIRSIRLPSLRKFKRKSIVGGQT